MTQFKNNPLTAHPLADQAEWWADDKATKEIETIRNQKTFDPAMAQPKAPARVQEAGLDVPRREGSLTMRAWKE